MNDTLKFIFLTLVVLACSNPSKTQDEQTQDSLDRVPAMVSDSLSKVDSMLSKVKDMVADLDEVRALRESVDKQSHGHNNVRLVIDRMPDKDNPYYWVAVVENNDNKMTRHLTYWVQADSSRILYYDQAIDSAIEVVRP